MGLLVRRCPTWLARIEQKYVRGPAAGMPHLPSTRRLQNTLLLPIDPGWGHVDFRG